MATMIEKQIAKAEKDIAKYTKSIERNTNLLEKKIAKAEKAGCNWSDMEWQSLRGTDGYTDDQWWIYIEIKQKREDIEMARRELARAQKALEELTGKADQAKKAQAEADEMAKVENDWLESKDKEQSEYEKWLKGFIAYCHKDGIEIERADSIQIKGTAGGKHFRLDINQGWTKRSLHCYNLMYDGRQIFTSGEFSTAYGYLKNKAGK